MSKPNKVEQEGEQEEEVVDLSNPEVVQFYRSAGEITNAALRKVIEACVPDAKVADLCNLGDKTILELLSKSFTKMQIDKGIAFPTCVSINNVCGHFCPLKVDQPIPLHVGDVVKIELGTQLGGFAALAAFTIIVSGKAVTVNDKRADVIAAAYTALDAAKRMVRAGKKNTDITNVIQQVATSFGVQTVEGVLSHEMKQYLIDGENVIIQTPTKDQKVEEFTIEDNQVFTIDIMFSTGAGKPALRDTRTTVFKRALDATYYLKLQASRALFGEINRKAPTFPFSLRTIMEDENKARLGVNEMQQHNLLEPFPVLYETDGEFVAHFQTTVLCMKNQTSPLNEFALATNVKSTKTCDHPDVKAALTLSTKKRAAKAKPKKKAEPEKEKEK